MKISNFSKLLGAGVLAASIAVVPFTLPASAQTDGTTTTGQGVEDTDYENDNDFDWGWLGLLGLAGLAGLAGRKRDDRDVAYRREDEVRTTNYR